VTRLAQAVRSAGGAEADVTRLVNALAGRKGATMSRTRDDPEVDLEGLLNAHRVQQMRLRPDLFSETFIRNDQAARAADHEREQAARRARELSEMKYREHNEQVAQKDFRNEFYNRFQSPHAREAKRRRVAQILERL
jgi:hypothetical protein